MKKKLTVKEVKALAARSQNGRDRPDLSGADLRGFDLREVNLSKAKLLAADLSQADLSGSNLEGTNLPYGISIWKQPICVGPICEGPACAGPICTKLTCRWSSMTSIPNGPKRPIWSGCPLRLFRNDLHKRGIYGEEASFVSMHRQFLPEPDG